MKKTLAIGLACALALGIVPLTACDPTPLESQLSHRLFESNDVTLAEMNLETKASLSYLGTTTRTSQKQTITISETTEEADVYTEAYDGEQYRYGVAFIRGNDTYSLTVTDQYFRAGYYDTLLEELKKGEKVLDHAEGGEIPDFDLGFDVDMEDLQSETGTKILRNLSYSLHGEATEEENGYRLTYTLQNVVDYIYEQFMPMAKAIDKNQKITVSQLYEGAGKNFFSGILSGVTAKEFYELIGNEGDTAGLFPEPKENETAYNYIKRTFKTEYEGEVPGNESVLDALEEMGLAVDRDKKLQESLEEFKKDGAKGIGSVILAALGIEGAEKADFGMSFTFDKEMAFNGMRISVSGSSGAGIVSVQTSMNIELSATPSRPIADVTGFYQNGASYWIDQTMIDSARISVTSVDTDNDWTHLDTEEAICTYTVNGDRLRIVITCRELGVKIDHTFDLNKTYESYQCDYGTVTVSQQWENPNGGYGRLGVNWSWTKYMPDAVYPDPREVYVGYDFSSFQNAYTKIPVTL